MGARSWRSNILSIFLFEKGHFQEDHYEKCQRFFLFYLFQSKIVVIHASEFVYRLDMFSSVSQIGATFRSEWNLAKDKANARVQTSKIKTKDAKNNSSKMKNSSTTTDCSVELQADKYPEDQIQKFLLSVYNRVSAQLEVLFIQSIRYYLRFSRQISAQLTKWTDWRETVPCSKMTFRWNTKINP